MSEHIYNIEPSISDLKSLSFINFHKNKKDNPSYFHDQFESKLKKSLKTDKEICTLNSGTSALHSALLLSKVNKGDVVFCANSTFIASVNPILYIGAEPYLIDIEKKTGNLNPEYLEKAIVKCLKEKKRPKAIIVTHSYGIPAMMNELLFLKKKYNLILIEDSAEALGSQYLDLSCGTIGDYGVFSFNTNKLVTAFGGGALTVNNLKEKKKVKSFSTQAKENGLNYIHNELGYNYRMNDMTAYLGSHQLNFLDKELKQKKKIFLWYKEMLSSCRGDISLHYQNEDNSSMPNRWMNCIKFACSVQKEKAQSIFLQNNIEARGIWYPLNRQKFLKNYYYEGNGEAFDLYASSLCIPSGLGLEKDDIYRIVQILHSI